jgi:hypothetical protein
MKQTKPKILYALPGLGKSTMMADGQKKGYKLGDTDDMLGFLVKHGTFQKIESSTRQDIIKHLKDYIHRNSAAWDFVFTNLPELRPGAKVFLMTPDDYVAHWHTPAMRTRWQQLRNTRKKESAAAIDKMLFQWAKAAYAHPDGKERQILHPGSWMGVHSPFKGPK